MTLGFADTVFDFAAGNVDDEFRKLVRVTRSLGHERSMAYRARLIYGGKNQTETLPALPTRRPSRALRATLLVYHLWKTYPKAFEESGRWTGTLPGDMGMLICKELGVSGGRP